MKKLLFTLLFVLLGVMTSQAQTYKKDANGDLVAVNQTTKKPDVKTAMIITKSDSIYPVYQGKKGGYYIKRISKKTGKEYKQYIKIQ